MAAVYDLSARRRYVAAIAFTTHMFVRFSWLDSLKRAKKKETGFANNLYDWWFWRAERPLK